MGYGMKVETGFYEGPEALSRFNAAMDKILSVSKTEMLRREAEYQKQSALNPNRRGPKARVAASPGAGAEPKL